MQIWHNPQFKEGLPDGPWMQEFDKAQWVDPDTGLDCMMRRHPVSGHWCGYVGIPPEHPLHGVHYNDDRFTVHAHGGITFTEGCQEDGDPSSAICHVPEPGRPANVWWAGFDCGHLGDLSPGTQRYFTWQRGDVYRDADYVKRECEQLAEQLHEKALEKKL